MQTKLERIQEVGVRVLVVLVGCCLWPPVAFPERPAEEPAADEIEG